MHNGPVKRVLGYSRFIVLIAVVGFAALSIATFVWGAAKSILLFDNLLEGKWREEASLVKVLQITDTYLLAVVQMIVALGLYELFIGRLVLPEWLIITSLDDLKKKVIDVLVVFVAVKGVEELFSDHSSADMLRVVGAVAILIAALTFFKWNAAVKPTKSDE